MIFNMAGVGGPNSGLNFKVVGGTTAPAVPVNNTIWVNTSTEITGWKFSARDPNLLNFSNWANNVTMTSGTKTVSGGSITLKATAADCYTNWGTSSYNNIPCTPGKTYVLEWDYTGASGNVFMFPGASTTNMVYTSNSSKKLELTIGSGITFFTFRFGVATSGNSTTYTNIRITEKGATFSPGHVWIKTGLSSVVKFNAFKKNNLQVYPLSAKQYINGQWVEKTAQTYMNGAWKEWQTYLFRNGTINTSLIGGWSKAGENSMTIAPFIGNGGSQSLGTTMNITWSAVSSSYEGAAIYATNNQINLTNVGYITVKLTASGNLTKSKIGVMSGTAPWSTSNTSWVNCAAIQQISSGTVTLDVTSLSGNYRVVIGGQSEGGTGTLTITEIYMQ